MLNNDDATVRAMARGSLLLDLQKRKITLAPHGEPGFLGFRKKPSESDRPDLNDFCNNNVQLNWVHTSGEQVSISEQ